MLLLPALRAKIFFIIAPEKWILKRLCKNKMDFFLLIMHKNISHKSNYVYAIHTIKCYF